MLKISEGKRSKQALTLRLEGSIVGPWVGELRRLCEPLVHQGGRLALDLADVSFADEGGLALLVGLRARGTKLLNPTPFVAEQLKSA
jgi:ABC-type transporter Mla MlaB component